MDCKHFIEAYFKSGFFLFHYDKICTPTLPFKNRIFQRRGGIFFHKKWPPLERSGEALQEQNRTPAVKDFADGDQ